MTFLNFIILDIIYNPKSNIDWTTIILTTLSTLAVGIILAFLGYYIWKKQFYYQKRLEIYGELIPYIHQLKIKLNASFLMAGSGDDMQYLKDIESEINPLLEKFVLYFNESHRKPIDELLKLLLSLHPWEKCNIDEDKFKTYVDEQVEKFITLKDKF